MNYGICFQHSQRPLDLETPRARAENRHVTDVPEQELHLTCEELENVSALTIQMMMNASSPGDAEMLDLRFGRIFQNLFNFLVFFGG